MSQILQVSVELCPEDRARLDAIIAGLARIVGAAAAAPLVAEAAAIIAPAAEAHPIDAPVAQFDPPAEEPAPEPAPVVSLGEFQKAVVVRCAVSPEMKKKVQALVKKYAESVSAVPAEKRAEVLAALAKL